MNIKNNIYKNYKALRKIVKKTPLEYNARLSKIYNANIFLKREDLQFTRSFKIRGAYNKILNSNIDSNKIIVCSSAGNHAQSIAYLSNILNIKCNIFLPKTTPQQKINRIKYFSNPELCNLTFAGNIFDECLQESKIFARNNNSIYIHPFDDLDVITGQGTIGLEIDKQQKMDYVIASVGGGGLLSGLSAYYNNKCIVYGVESEYNDSMKQSIKNKKIVTLNNNDFFVDGSAVKTPGQKTFDICKNYVHGFYKVSNDRVCYDLIDLYQNDGIVCELAGVMSISCLHLIKEQIKNKNVCCVISGGNNDVLRLREIYDKKLIYENKLHYFIFDFYQKPGELRKFINNILDKNDDIVRFEYLKKNNKDVGSVLIGVNSNNVYEIINKLNYHNYQYYKLNTYDMIFKYLI
jgi:threonine dehydratase